MNGPAISCSIPNSEIALVNSGCPLVTDVASSCYPDGCIFCIESIQEATWPIGQGRFNQVHDAAGHVLPNPDGDFCSVGTSPFDHRSPANLRNHVMPEINLVRLLRAGHPDTLPVITIFPGPE